MSFRINIPNDLSNEMTEECSGLVLHIRGPDVGGLFGSIVIPCLCMVGCDFFQFLFGEVFIVFH